MKLERIPVGDHSRAMPALFRHALATRDMMERAWDDRTAYQGIVLQPDDPISRGQCGVTSTWFSRYLVRQGVDARFTEGTIELTNGRDEHVWVEVHDIADEPLVVDLTSDQYRSVLGTSVHVGHYGSDVIGHYQPKEHFDPFHLPQKKMMARFAILEANIARLPRRQRVALPN
jgi:hypothetical protein